MIQVNEERADEYSPWKEVSCCAAYEAEILKVKYGTRYTIKEWKGTWHLQTEDYI